MITLNRPEARNALTWGMYALLEELVRTAEVRCLVITGADPAFCSGDDVRQVMGGGDRPPPVATEAGGGPRLTPAAAITSHPAWVGSPAPGRAPLPSPAHGHPAAQIPMATGCCAAGLEGKAVAQAACHRQAQARPINDSREQANGQGCSRRCAGTPSL